LLLALPAEASPGAPFCFIAPLGERARYAGLVLARELRALGAAVDLDGRGGSLRSMLRRADAVGAAFCMVLGDSELDRGVVQVKDLRAHVQDEVARPDAARAIVARLRGSATSSTEGSP
jgi:histidyl-tRNA synthetase